MTCCRPMSDPDPQILNAYHRLNWSSFDEFRSFTV